MSLKINSIDFKELRYSIFMRNEASQVDVAGDGLIRLTEISEKKLSLEVPSTSCKKGQYLTLFICKEGEKGFEKLPKFGMQLQAGFSVGVKVTEKIDLDNLNRSIIQLTLTQFDEEEWDSLCKSYEERQDNINEFVETSKY